MAAAAHSWGVNSVKADTLDLGFTSADGVTYKIKQHTKDWFTDEKGEAIPTDVIHLGSEAEITFELWKPDLANVKTFIAKRSGGTFGANGTVGELMIANSRVSTLTIAGGTAGKTLTFYNAYIKDDAEFANLSVSTPSRIVLTIRSLPNASGIVMTETTSP